MVLFSWPRRPGAGDEAVAGLVHCGVIGDIDPDGDVQVDPGGADADDAGGVGEMETDPAADDGAPDVDALGDQLPNRGLFDNFAILKEPAQDGFEQIPPEQIHHREADAELPVRVENTSSALGVIGSPPRTRN
jgi:hypothetical protein